MRSMLKITLLAIMALALAASSASALTVSGEGSGPCGTVSLSGTTGVTGGCLIHATSEGTVVLKKHVFGIESTITSCTNEFHGRIATDASTQIFEQVLGGAGCTRQACETSGEKNRWTANGFEGFTAIESNKYLTTTFCVEPINQMGNREECEIDVPFDESPVDHRYEFGHVIEISGHATSPFKCEVLGHWNSERDGTEDGASEVHIEVNH